VAGQRGGGTDAVLGFGVTGVISDETPVLAELMARGL
jgi:hypothetical protein